MGVRSNRHEGAPIKRNRMRDRISIFLTYGFSLRAYATTRKDAALRPQLFVSVTILILHTPDQIR